MERITHTFATKGFVKAGGMWGDAQWLQVSEGLVIAIGQDIGGFAAAEFGEASQNADYLCAPANHRDPCQVWMYRGPFFNGWKVTDGEAPHDDGDRVEIHTNLTLAQAIALAESFK